MHGFSFANKPLECFFVAHASSHSCPWRTCILVIHRWTLSDIPPLILWHNHLILICDHDVNNVTCLWPHPIMWPVYDHTPSCDLFMTTPPIIYVNCFDHAYIWCISTAPSDYTAVREVLVFPPSLSNQILPLRIPISNDLVYEGGAEMFSVRLEIPSERGVSAGLQNTAIVTIEEDGMTYEIMLCHCGVMWCHVMSCDVMWCH